MQYLTYCYHYLCYNPLSLSVIKPAILAAMPFMLLFIAGIVDAIGFIHLKNGLFVSFMSGNTTHVAMLLSSHQYGQSFYYIGVIFLFVAGITVGEMIAVLQPQNYRWLVMSTVSILLFSAIFIEKITVPIATNFVLAFARWDYKILRQGSPLIRQCH